MGIAPSPVKGGKVFIKGLAGLKKQVIMVLNELFSTRQVTILNTSGVIIQKGNIILQGTGGGFKGKIYNTGLKAIDFFY